MRLSRVKPQCTLSCQAGMFGLCQRSEWPTKYKGSSSPQPHLCDFYGVFNVWQVASQGLGKIMHKLHFTYQELAHLANSTWWICPDCTYSKMDTMSCSGDKFGGRLEQNKQQSCLCWERASLPTTFSTTDNNDVLNALPQCQTTNSTSSAINHVEQPLDRHCWSTTRSKSS